MHALKKMARGLSSQAYKLSLFFIAFSAATIGILGSPTVIKANLKSSGIYSQIVDSAYDQALKNQDTQNSDVPFSDPAVKTAVKNALPPEFIEQTSNNALDGLYGWLQGKTTVPQFTVDLTEAKQKLATGIGQVGYDRVSALPVCTVAQLKTLDRNNIDIFSLPCQPPGIDLKAQQAKLVSQLSTSDDFLKQTTFSANDLPKENGKTVFERLSIIPTLYQWFVRLPWILGGVAAVTAGCLILLHDERRRAFWLLGRSMALTGVLLGATSVLGDYLATQIKMEGTDVSQVIPDVIRRFVHTFDHTLLVFGGVYLAIGGITMLALYLTKPKKPAEEPGAPVSTEVSNPIETPLETPIQTEETPQPAQKIEIKKD